jgi:2-hydroxychromene-2-carboxylate isomerase
MTSASTPQEIKFYFDPICPWAWRASLWLREARQYRPLRVSWGFFSLDAINRAAGNPPKPRHQHSLTPFRIMALARRQEGDDAVDRLYLGFGRAHHERQQDIGQPDAIVSVLDEAGFDRGLLDAALADPTVEQELAQEHAALAGKGAFGVPTLEMAGMAPMYGPIIDRVPTGDAAGELWDHTAWLLAQPHIYEFKRARATPAAR